MALEKIGEVTQLLKLRYRKSIFESVNNTYMCVLYIPPSYIMHNVSGLSVFISQSFACIYFDTYLVPLAYA